MKVRGIIKTVQAAGIVAGITRVLADHGVDLEYFSARVDADEGTPHKCGVIEVGGTFVEKEAGASPATAAGSGGSGGGTGSEGEGSSGAAAARPPQLEFERRTVPLIQDLYDLGTVLNQRWYRPRGGD